MKMGARYFETGQFKKAISEYKKAIKKDPKNIQAYEEMGKLYAFGTGQLLEGLSCFHKAIKINPSNYMKVLP